MTEKTCFKCKELKPLESFYKHPEMKDGRLNKCKECNKKDVRENYASHRQHYQEYERRRANSPSHIKAKKIYAKTEAGKAAFSRANKKWKNNNSEKIAAHLLVRYAIKAGRIIKPVNCQECGKGDVRIEGHHEDYAKPLEVNWLCSPCHRKRHR